MKYTHKTEHGIKARILSEDVKDEYNIAVAVLGGDGGESVMMFKREVDGSLSRPFIKLKEISPWDDVAVDTPIWVRYREDGTWLPRHFCKYINGKVYAWGQGFTSHTVCCKNAEFSHWPFAVLENPNGN